MSSLLPVTSSELATIRAQARERAIARAPGIPTRDAVPAGRYAVGRGCISPSALAAARRQKKNQKRNEPAGRRTSNQRPELIPGAAWQAGVTPGSSNWRVFINGEPAPLCFAANPRLGWALVYVAKNYGRPLEERSAVYNPTTTDRLKSSAGAAVVDTISGVIELRRCLAD